MKTKLFKICAYIFVFIATEKAYSQDFTGKDKPDNLVAYNSLSTNNISHYKDSVKNINSVTVNNKVEKSFAKYFNNNTQQNWYMLGKDFLNRFYDNGNLINALFSKNGQLIYTIKYTTEKNLPADVRKIVKKEYYDYIITMATEIKEDNRDIWVVKLDNASEQITVRIEDEEIEKVQQFQKLNPK